MPVNVVDENFVLKKEEVEGLWQAVKKRRKCADDIITLKSVSQIEIRRLNLLYRKQDIATNVLTFSYGQRDHDVAICLTVAEREAKVRNLSLHDYTVVLVVHALLHVAGMDHEASKQAAEEMEAAEEAVLNEVGLAPNHL